MKTKPTNTLRAALAALALAALAALGASCAPDAPGEHDAKRDASAEEGGHRLDPGGTTPAKAPPHRATSAASTTAIKPLPDPHEILAAQIETERELRAAAEARAEGESAWGRLCEILAAAALAAAAGAFILGAAIGSRGRRYASA